MSLVTRGPGEVESIERRLAAAGFNGAGNPSPLMEARPLILNVLMVVASLADEALSR